MDIPIVLIHKKDHECLNFSLRSAKFYQNDVTLITDIAPEKYDCLAKIVDINKIESTEKTRFSKCYQHMSTNSYEFEYICIERWFVLLEYMKRNNMNEVIYIDSDVIIYENLTKIIQKYYPYDICLCIPKQNYNDFIWVSSGHTLFCTFIALEEFCNYILDIYTNNLNEIQLKWQWHKDNKKPGGINDMTLLYLFQKETKLKTGNFLSVVNNTFCFDSQINSSSNNNDDEYQTKGSFLLGKTLKKISFKNRHPYVYNKLINKNIQFMTLHFQSDAKRIMPLYIKDFKTIKRFFSDFTQIIKMTYYAIRRIFSLKIIVP